MIDKIGAIKWCKGVPDFYDFLRLCKTVDRLVDAVNALEQDKKAIDIGRFKEGDKVLVRHIPSDTWQPRIYECMYGKHYRMDTGSTWKYCIPFDIDKWGTV